ncbi:XRE family transcription regulator protein [Herbaspirillum frisingense GSF30]|uniref:XRE family transcription regulator protein n=2 Tax=Herbaspirillum frisingense TaxID=92645 RepID=A0AAI9N193_9BURK|nr:helix-turn-helix transcriptional regulator [Herbaspirillum frisingense]EOA02135.1 XRE family transcription regulator protein [Herbaspirillum frisingense GSF30]
MEPDLARRALGAFLKSQREQTAPSQAGLPHLAHGRRRTPGLRREEVAQLCGISVTWYTWIEQGRTDSVSPQALARIADALHLPRAKRAYLFELAGKKDPALPEQQAVAVIAPEILDVVGNFRAPAYLLDRYWNAVAWNPAACKLFVGWLDQGEAAPNLLRFMFARATAQALTIDWEQRARRLVAEFRADSASLLDDPDLLALVEELSAASPLFKRAWHLQDVVEREGGERRFQHPQSGELRYRQVNFRVANRPDLKLVTLMPDAPAPV